MNESVFGGGAGFPAAESEKLCCVRTHRAVYTPPDNVMNPDMGMLSFPTFLGLPQLIVQQLWFYQS